MKNKARLIITFECKRNCPYCCNGYKSIMDNAKTITNLEELKDYEEVLITGGEPMLNIERTLGIIKELGKQGKVIYLYSANYEGRWLPEVIGLIDGLHFTIHSPASQRDVYEFEELQRDIARYRISGVINKSWRLYIDNEVSKTIKIVPALWNRLEVKPWIKEEDCRLPLGETLFILGEKSKVVTESPH